MSVCERVSTYHIEWSGHESAGCGLAVALPVRFGVFWCVLVRLMHRHHAGVHPRVCSLRPVSQSFNWRLSVVAAFEVGSALQSG